MEIIAKRSTADEACATARSFAPDIMFLEIDMSVHGLDVAETIAQICPGTKVVMLTAAQDDQDLVTAI